MIRTISSAGDLGAAVRGRRSELGLSQAEVARLAGVSRPWLSMVEAGKATTELGLIIRLLDALDLSLQVTEAPVPTGDVDLDAHLSNYENR